MMMRDLWRFPQVSLYDLRHHYRLVERDAWARPAGLRDQLTRKHPELIRHQWWCVAWSRLAEGFAPDCYCTPGWKEMELATLALAMAQGGSVNANVTAIRQEHRL